MNEKIAHIKSWLGTGSINIFGIQFSGKDTVGEKLTALLNAKFISSGDVMRQVFANKPTDSKDEIWQAAKAGNLKGVLMPTDEFQQMMITHLMQPEFDGFGLILSTVGRWIGEEGPIMKILEETGHPTKAVLLINISEEEAWRRWRAIDGQRNEGRQDDTDEEKVTTRLKEYREKTLPVIEVYRRLGLLIEIDGEQSREDVLSDAIDAIYNFSRAQNS